MTGGDHAAVFVVMANVVDGGDRLPTLFVVDRELDGDRDRRRPGLHPQLSRRPSDDPLHATSRSRETDVIGGVGGGDELQRSWFTEERLGIAARCGGAIWRLLDETVAWTTAREQGGARVFDHQGVSFPLADSAADARRRAACSPSTVAELADAGADPKLVHHKASMAKLFTSEAAWRCADRCVQAFGGRGYLRSNVAERLLRELRVDRIWEGTSEIQRLIVARGLERRGVERDPPLSAATGRRADLTPLLAPRSVAVVGANDRPGSYADTVLRNLERAGFDGPVYGVNPRRDRSTGGPASRRVADLPEPVDAVVVAIPAAGVAAGDRALRPSAAAAARSSSPPASARSRSGRGARARAGARRALEAGLPVCGPNGNGVVAVGSRAPLWGDSVPPLRPGRVAMVSQSGNVAVNAIGSRRGIDFHTLVSTGNQAVARRQRLARGARARPTGVGSVALFLEADGDGARLAEALARCAERRVGVAVLKVGASEAGARAAAAHTGALAGDQRVFRALVEEAGGAWAADPHELLELARVLAEPRARPRRPGGLAVLTCSGGDSGLAADEAERAGVELPELAAATARRAGGAAARARRRSPTRSTTRR